MPPAGWRARASKFIERAKLSASSTGLLIAAWITVFGLGLAVAGALYPRVRAQRIEVLMLNAQRCAVAFSDGLVNQLTGTAADLQSPAYQEIKARLARLRELDKRIRFVYLMRRSGSSGEVVFLADSEDPNSDDVSNPGDDYPEARSSPGLQAILRDGRPSMEGPLRDSFGTWVTGYAAVRTAEDGSVRDVLGIDVSTRIWHIRIWERTGLAAGAVWFAFGVPLAFWTIVRHRLRSAEVIRRLSVALDQCDAAVLIVDGTNRIDYVNGGLCRQTGYAASDLIGQRWDLLPGMSRLSTLSRARALRALERGNTWQGQWLNTRKDGTTYPVHGVVSPVRNNRQVTQCVIALFNDVSQLKLAEAELRAAKEQADAGNAAKSSFLAMMSHEMRTPLNGVIGLTSVLAQTSLTTEQRECLGLIRSSGESLLHTIDDLLDLTKVDAGHLELDAQTFDPRHLIRDTVRSLGVLAAEKKLTLEVSFADSVPAAVIADPARLRQVLVNLIGNALKFTEHGRVQILAHATESVSTGSPPGSVCLQIAVRDTGIGIPREKLSELFRPFRQLDASTSRRYGGTGLGLAISKRLCELMGGTISVETVEGRGSTFQFSIKAGKAPSPESVDRHPGLIEIVTPSIDAAPLRILLVEDNAVNAVVALKMLRSLGYAADHARNGRAALQAFDEQHHDLVLMDLQMPGMDGWTTTRELRARTADAQPWIIALTADAMDGVRERCLAVGMNAYLTKPLVLERLAAELSRAVAERTARHDESDPREAGRVL